MITRLKADRLVFIGRLLSYDPWLIFVTVLSTLLIGTVMLIPVIVE